MTYKIKIESEWGYLLRDSIRNEINRRWKESVWYASVEQDRPNADDVLWSESIDQLADIKLQLLNQSQVF